MSRSTISTPLSLVPPEDETFPTADDVRLAYRECAALMCSHCAKGDRPRWMIVFGGYTHVWKTGNGHSKCMAGRIWENLDEQKHNQHLSTLRHVPRRRVRTHLPGGPDLALRSRLPRLQSGEHISALGTCATRKPGSIAAAMRLRLHRPHRDGNGAEQGTAPQVALRMYLLVTARKGISSLQLAKEIGVTQKTAWFILGRLRKRAATTGREAVSTNCAARSRSTKRFVGGLEAKTKHEQNM